MCANLCLSAKELDAVIKRATSGSRAYRFPIPGLDDYAELGIEEDDEKSVETEIPMLGLQGKSDSEGSYEESDDESSEPTNAN